MTAPINLNRERLSLLRAIQAGHVQPSAGGRLIRRVRAGQNRIVERAVRELRNAGLVDTVELRLTPAGDKAIGGDQP